MMKAQFVLILILISSKILYAQETLTLSEAIEHAVNNSITLTSLKAKIQSSRLVVHEQWRQLLPQVSLQYTKQDEVAIRQQDVRTQSLMCTLQYDIFTNRKAWLSYSISQLESLLAVEEYNIHKNTVILNTKKVYYDLQKKKKAIDIYTLCLKPSICKNRL